jgi:hypothetical protein
MKDDDIKDDHMNAGLLDFFIVLLDQPALGIYDESGGNCSADSDVVEEEIDDYLHEDEFCDHQLELVQLESTRLNVVSKS